MGPKMTKYTATHRRKSLWHTVSCKHGSPGGEGAGPSCLRSQRPRGQGQVHGGLPAGGQGVPKDQRAPRLLGWGEVCGRRIRNLMRMFSVGDIVF